MTAFPPRLHVLLARKARTAVVLRRGPSDTYCAIEWNRAYDTFRVGQWLRARVYERRSDLSPDGNHLIYFALTGHWGSATRGSWTAVSRAPYFTAVALWAKGDGWHGGGLFVDDRSYWLNDGYGHQLLGETGEVRRTDEATRGTQFGGECPGVYYPRLVRDGWQLREELAHGAKLASVDVFEKPLGHGWTLRKLAHAMVGPPEGKSVYFDEHELVGPDGRELARPGWEWADLDRDRVVWASEGSLWAGRITARSASRDDDPIEDARVLHDFSDMSFAAIEPPYEGINIRNDDDRDDDDAPRR